MSSTRATGIALAFVAALISGVAIFVNGHAVRHFGDATVYTTAKNAVAGVLLLAFAAPLLGGPRSELPSIRRHRLGLLAIAVIGGSVPFVLFFEGLSRAEATQAAFIQKTLVIWVAFLAVPPLVDLIRTRLNSGALLIAFAPAQAPTIAVVVVKERAGAGSAQSAPVARAIIEAWLKLPPLP